MFINVTAEIKVNGEKYKVGIRVDRSTLTEKLIKMSFVGPIGQPFKHLLIAMLRAEEIMHQKANKNASNGFKTLSERVKL